MKLFVWDFHGVLEKGNDFAVLEITNRILENFGHAKRMTQLEAEFLSGKHWHEYFAYLLPHLDHTEHLALQSACIQFSQSSPSLIAKHIQLNDYADYVLKKIRDSQLTQILISNTQSKSLDMFIDIVGIGQYFSSTHRFGIDAHTQKKKSKKDQLESFLEGKHFPKGIISIGDSPGDMALIENRENSVGYLYTHPGRQHRPAPCHYKIHDLRDVLKEIN